MQLNRIQWSAFVLSFILLFSSTQKTWAYGGPDIQAFFQKIAQAHPEIPTPAIQKVSDYFQDHADLVKNKNYVTIINFNDPSTTKRMYVINMLTAAVESYFAAHGKNSGDLYATEFSNENNSFKSSLGIYLTAAPIKASTELRCA